MLHRYGQIITQSSDICGIHDRRMRIICRRTNSSFIFKKDQEYIRAYTANGLLFLAIIGILYIGFEQQYIYLIYIGAFILGFCDCFCFCLACSIGGHWKEPGISLFNTGQSVTVAMLSVPTIFLDLPWMILIYCVIFILATVSLWVHRKAVNEIHLEHQ